MSSPPRRRHLTRDTSTTATAPSTTNTASSEPVHQGPQGQKWAPSSGTSYSRVHRTPTAGPSNYLKRPTRPRLPSSSDKDDTPPPAAMVTTCPPTPNTPGNTELTRQTNIGTRNANSWNRLLAILGTWTHPLPPDIVHLRRPPVILPLDDR